MKSTSCEMPGWMSHKLESRLLGEISVISDTQMTLSLWRKWRVTKETLDKGERGEWKSWLKTQFNSVQSLSHVWLPVTPWTAAHQASLSITNSWSPPKPMSIESVMPSNHLILHCPLLLPSIFPSIRVFSYESVLHIRWPNYRSFSFNTSPSKEHPGLISFRL